MGVTAVGMDVVSEATAHMVVPMAPNVCMTPAAPSPMPLPYPLMGDSGSLDPGCEEVTVGGKKAMSSNCKVAQVMGNEAGAQKDIVTMQTGGKAWAMMGAPTVMFEGGMAVITSSPGFANTL
jgi:hypothetical protein